ncbi:MAG TPA: ParB/RepB/Spo0J family partition protein [Candidatus Bathyarchaeia archaeon]|nr:ParB/RepB/Spo0J family partition protein [Candidatus Bathyarchaeia archaeon]
MSIGNKRWKTISVEKLVAADWNYKEEEEDKEEKLKNNIKRNGQIENIIVRKLKTGFYEVVNGNHRLKVLKELEYDKIVCYSLGKISDNKARRIAIETNETKFERDNVKFAQLMKEISGEGGFDLSDLAQTMPFGEEELKGFVDMLDFDWESFRPKDKDDEDEENENNKLFQVQCKCPECGHQFSLNKKGI